MVTREAQEELAILKQEEQTLITKVHEMMMKGYKQEARGYESKLNRIYDKMRDVERLGLSSNETRAIKRAIPDMTTIRIEKSLGVRGFEKAGFVPKLKQYVIVRGSKYNDFMRNVRGCSSLAGTVDISNVRFINKRIYDDIVKGIEGHGVTSDTYFISHQRQIRGKTVKNESEYEMLKYLY